MVVEDSKMNKDQISSMCQTQLQSASNSEREKISRKTHGTSTPGPAWKVTTGHDSPKSTYWYSFLTIMARIYPSFSILGLFVFALLQSLVSAHMIDVDAGKKECFFEDLHKNDKVCMHGVVCIALQTHSATLNTR